MPKTNVSPAKKLKCFQDVRQLNAITIAIEDLDGQERDGAPQRREGNSILGYLHGDYDETTEVPPTTQIENRISLECSIVSSSMLSSGSVDGPSLFSSDQQDNSQVQVIEQLIADASSSKDDGQAKNLRRG